MKNLTRRRFPLILSLSLIILLFICSLFYNGQVEPTFFKYDQEGNLIGRAPFEPTLSNLLGTDRNGNDLLLRLLEGAKYTLLISLLIPLITIVLSLIISITINFGFIRIKKYILMIVKPFDFMPKVALYLMIVPSPIFIIEEKGYLILIVFQVSILIFLGIPSITSNLNSHIEYFIGKPFIEVSYHLGANKLHVVMRHILPLLKPSIIIFYLNQVIDTLTTLMYLGIFNSFIGGTKSEGVFNQDNTHLTKSAEWSGMLGQARNDIFSAPWIILAPALAFTFLIILINIIAEYAESDINKISGKYITKL